MTSSKLRRGQLCPLHKSYFCCGRETVKRRERFDKPKFYKQSVDVRVVEDPFHPRGYREICSSRELTRRKARLLLSGETKCLYCPEPLTDFRDVELAHKEPKGMGGARRDDSMDNLALSHRACNRANGSKRPAV